MKTIWKRRHTGWWENPATGDVVCKAVMSWWLLPKKGKVSHHKSLRAAQKAAKDFRTNRK